jgi:DNA-binding response OmpR family regulator
VAGRPARILCLGKNPGLLRSRCAVLAHNGYHAEFATIPEGFEQLRTEKYDLLIVSSRLVKENGKLLPAEIPTLVLDGIVFPTEFLHAVSEKLILSEWKLG